MTISTSDLKENSDQKSRVGVTERVATVLSDRIESGEYVVGDLLPAERILAADLGVHRRSVRLAIDQLVIEGKVTRRRNCRPTIGRQLQPEQPSRSAPPRISTSNLIALIMWHGGGPLEHARTSQQRIFWGMNQPLMQIGYHAVFLDLVQQMGTGSNTRQQMGTEEENAEQEARHLRYVLEQGFGGAIFYPYAYRSNRELIEQVNHNMPLVLLDRKIPGYDTDCVSVENHRSMYEITRLLIDSGHRRIAYITQSEPIKSVRDRLQGYVDAIQGQRSTDVSEMVLTMPWSTNNVHKWTVFDAVFRLQPDQRPTAVVCVNDYSAVAVSEHLELLGLSIPDDVVVTGFDDIIPSLPNGVGLTTIAQPYEQIGVAAVDLLMRRIADKSAPTQSVELPGKLIIRESTGGQTVLVQPKSRQNFIPK